jgi:predicted transcriptional regulator
MLSKGREMAVDTVMLTVRVSIVLQLEEIHRALAEADAGGVATAEELAALNTTYQS